MSAVAVPDDRDRAKHKDTRTLGWVLGGGGVVGIGVGAIAGGLALGKKSVTYECNFAYQGRPVASGQTTTVCCRFQGDGTPKSINIPDWIAEKLARAQTE